jgi:hypothetical protein
MATRAGLFDAPAPIFGPRTTSPHSEASGDAVEGSERPIATLYSTVVTGGPVRSERGHSPSVADTGLLSSQGGSAPLLSTAEFEEPGLAAAPDDDESWTPVLRIKITLLVPVSHPPLNVRQMR